jgi:hypothetical protein
MDARHLAFLVLMLGAAYWVGSNYPGWLSKISMGYIKG